MNHWEFLDKELIPSYAEMNKQIGKGSLGSRTTKKGNGFNSDLSLNSLEWTLKQELNLLLI
jgi:hypothetical protein